MHSNTKLSWIKRSKARQSAPPTLSLSLSALLLSSLSPLFSFHFIEGWGAGKVGEGE
jgi:hypothetical protein